MRLSELLLLYTPATNVSSRRKFRGWEGAPSPPVGYSGRRTLREIVSLGREQDRYNLDEIDCSTSTRIVTSYYCEPGPFAILTLGLHLPYSRLHCCRNSSSKYLSVLLTVQSFPMAALIDIEINQNVTYKIYGQQFFASFVCEASLITRRVKCAKM